MRILVGMADRDQERENDRATIDHAISKLVALIDEGEVLKGCAALVPLLERRSKLLGLDVPTLRQGEPEHDESPIDRMTREIAAQGHQQAKS